MSSIEITYTQQKTPTERPGIGPDRPIMKSVDYLDMITRKTLPE